MSHEITGDDLFGKYTEGNLNKKGLQRAKKKELVDIIESNLPFMVESYFGTFQKKERKYLNNVYELVGSEKYFMDPLMKLLNGGKKKKKKDVDLDNIPKGLHVILLDSIDRVKQKYNERISRFAGQNRTKETEEYLAEIKELAEAQAEQLGDIINILIKKDVKKLKKLGIKEQYATRIARCFVPAKYLNKHNVGRYLHRLNRTLVDVQRYCMVKSDEVDEDGNTTYMNDAGINLANDDNIMDLYEIFFSKVDRSVYLVGLTSVLLETRSRVVDNFNKPQRDMYNAISRVVCDLLEGESVLNITGDKLSKKELKNEVISKKELRKIMKMYSSQRAEDYRKGYDAPRRIVLSNLSEESYPKLIGSFAKENKTTAKDVLEGTYEDADRERAQEEQQRRQQQNNQNKNSNINGGNNNRRSNNKK